MRHADRHIQTLHLKTDPLAQGSVSGHPGEAVQAVACSAASAHVAASLLLGRTVPQDRTWAVGEPAWPHAGHVRPVEQELATTARPGGHGAVPREGEEEPGAAPGGEEEGAQHLGGIHMVHWAGAARERKR